MASVVLNIGVLWSIEELTGSICAVCSDKIYGKGHRMIVATQTLKDVLPKFKETNFVICDSCKDAIG